MLLGVPQPHRSPGCRLTVELRTTLYPPGVYEQSGEALERGLGAAHRRLPAVAHEAVAGASALRRICRWPRYIAAWRWRMVSVDRGNRRGTWVREAFEIGGGGEPALVLAHTAGTARLRLPSVIAHAHKTLRKTFPPDRGDLAWRFARTLSDEYVSTTLGLHDPFKILAHTPSAGCALCTRLSA
jgi:hypothetical protein